MGIMPVPFTANSGIKAVRTSFQDFRQLHDTYVASSHTVFKGTKFVMHSLSLNDSTVFDSFRTNCTTPYATEELDAQLRYEFMHQIIWICVIV